MVDQKEFSFLKELRTQLSISQEIHNQMEMEIRDGIGENDSPVKGTSQNISDSVISKSTIIGTKIEVKQNALGNIENHYDRMIDALDMGNMVAAKKAYDDAKLVDVDDAKKYFHDNGKKIAIGYNHIAYSYALKLSEIDYREERQGYGLDAEYEVPYGIESEMERITDDHMLARGNADAFYNLNFELYEQCRAAVTLYLKNPKWQYFKSRGFDSDGLPNPPSVAYATEDYEKSYASSMKDLWSMDARGRSSFIYGHCKNLIESSEDYDKDRINGEVDDWVNESVSIYPPCNTCKGAGKETNTCQNCRGKGSITVSSGFLGLSSSQKRCSNCNGSGRLIKTGGQVCNSCNGWKLDCSGVESEIIPYPIQ